LCDIVVVDNSTDNDQIRLLNNELSNKQNIYIVKSICNLGYFSGMDLGLNYYIKLKGRLPKWIVISNTDILFDSIDFLDLLFSMQKKSVDAVIAPRIISSKTGTEQNPYMTKRPSWRKMFFLSIIYRNIFLYKAYYYMSNLKKRLTKRFQYNKISYSNQIYAPHGSFIILDRIFFEKKGCLRYDGYLYGEEIYLGEQVLNLGLTICYNKQLVIHHTENATTSSLSTASNMQYRYNAIKYLINYMYGNLN
jgi:GT2 family glycosyltransferase